MHVSSSRLRQLSRLVFIAAGGIGFLVSGWLALEVTLVEIRGENILQRDGIPDYIVLLIPIALYGSLTVLAGRISSSRARTRWTWWYLAASVLLPLLLGSLYAYVLFGIPIGLLILAMILEE